MAENPAAPEKTGDGIEESPATSTASLWDEMLLTMAEKDEEAARLREELNRTRSQKPQASVVKVVERTVTVTSPPQPIPQPPVQETTPPLPALEQELSATVVNSPPPTPPPSVKKTQDQPMKPPSATRKPPPSPTPPPMQPKPRQDLLEYLISRPFVKKHARLITALIALGWIFFVIFLWMTTTSVVSVGYRWVCGIGPDQKTLGQDSKFHPSHLPFDPYGHVLSYPDRSRRTPQLVLYPIQSPRTNRAISNPCQVPVNFSIATRRLVSEGVSMNVQTEKGLIGLKDLRYSLQMRIIENDFDYMCAQTLDIPLCYCMALVENINTKRREWLDIVGRVNLTCISLGSTSYSSEINSMCLEPSFTTSTSVDPTLTPLTRRPQKRFSHVCVDYEDMRGVLYRRASSGVEAVIMQQIFEVERGLSPCDSSLDRTIALFKTEVEHDHKHSEHSEEGPGSRDLDVEHL